MELTRDQIFAAQISQALSKAATTRGLRIKTVASWTDSNERTVKNWFSGQYGPSGSHLVQLAHYSDEVLEVVLQLIGRENLIAAGKFADIERRLVEVLAEIRGLRH